MTEREQKSTSGGELGTVRKEDLDQLLGALVRVMQGDLGVRLPVEDPDQVMDAIHLAINTMCEELAAERDALRETEQRFRTVTSAAQDAVIMMGAQAQILLWNDAAERIFGWRREEAVGQQLHALLAPTRFRQAFEAGYAVFSRTGTGAAVGNTVELMALHKDGHEFPIELSLAAVEAGDRWHAIGNVRDITRRQAAEKRLAEARQQLEARVSELEEAAVHIKTLQGILPICMFCKQIKQDDKSWQRIDSYLSEHTDAMVSHSLCPTCAHKHYPGLDE